MKRLTWKTLKNLWNVNVSHGAYRESGDWFHQLRHFPAALFDRHGYVRFQTEDEYQSSPYLQRKKDLHVPGGIEHLPNYVRIDGHDRT